MSGNDSPNKPTLLSANSKNSQEPNGKSIHTVLSPSSFSLRSRVSEWVISLHLFLTAENLPQKFSIFGFLTGEKGEKVN